MHSADYLSIDRLAYIPEKHWKAHEFCFFLHDHILQALLEYESSDIHNATLNAFRDVVKGREEEFQDVELLSFLKSHNLTELYEHHITCHVTFGLVSDMLNFLYEALSCFEKRKFSVGFSLLRKPLKEHLLFLSWLLSDKADFIRRFEANNYETLNNVPKEKKIELFKSAVNHLATKEAFDGEVVWEMINSRSNPNSFEALLQKSTHLITSMGQLLRTDDYSLNFVFEDPSENYHYEFLYSKLPYLLMFVTQVSLSLFDNIAAINKNTYSRFVLSTMGCFESIFHDGRGQHVTKMLRASLKEFLTCIHCEAPLKITKRNAASFYLSENIVCGECGANNDFPLYWLLAKAKVRVAENANYGDT